MSTDLPPYPEYKDSGVPWLGKVPEHWEVLPARAAYRPKRVKNTGMVEKTVLSLSFGRIIVKPDAKLHGLVPESFETYQVVDPGNIIIRTTDLQNDQKSLRTGYSNYRGIITSAYMCLGTTGRVSKEFGYQFLNAYDLLKIIYGFGSGLRQNLDFSDIKQMPVLVPPPPEQAAIVRFLDHSDRRIRRYIAAKKKLIALLNEQKQAIIHRAVTRGLDPNVRLKPSGVQLLGDVPEHWDVLALKRVLRSLIDCEHKTAPVVQVSDYRVVRTTAVRHGRLQMEGTYCTSVDGFRDWTRRGSPEPGDVLFTREAPAGEACVVPTGMRLCLGQRTVLMKLRRDRYDPQFLVHMIYGGPPADRIRLASQGSTVGHFNMDDIAALTVLAPPVSEQSAIVNQIEETTRPLLVAEERAEREVNLLLEYRTRLIADVVTGRLDVREPAARLPDGAEEPGPLDGVEALAEGDESEDEADLDTAAGEAES